MKYVLLPVYRTIKALIVCSVLLATYLVVVPLTFLWHFSWKKVEETFFPTWSSFIEWDENIYHHYNEYFRDERKVFRSPIHYIRNISLADESNS